MAAAQQAASSGSAGKGGAEGGSGDVMEKAELKQLLMISKRRPVSCVVGMAKDGSGVILLDKRMKPKKLVAELKRSAKEKSIDLEISTLRFGRAAVDENSSVQFTVNKESPGALRMKLLERIKPAGFPKCQIGVDEKLEAESDDDEAPGSQAGAGTHGGANTGDTHGDGGETPAGSGAGTATGGGTGHGASPMGGDTGGGTAGGPETGSGTGQPQAGEAGGGTGTAASGTPGPTAQTAPDGGAQEGGTQEAGTQGGKSLKDRLAGLIQKIAGVAATNPAAKAGLLQMAKAVMDAMKSGDAAKAGKAVDELEKALGGGSTADGATGAADAGTGAGTSSPPGDAPDGSAPGGQTAPGQTPAGQTPAGSAGGRPPQAAAANSQTPPDGSGGRGRGQHGSPVFEKARQTWVAVRAKIQRDIDTVMKGFEGELGQGSADAKMIHECFQPILKSLDDSLSTKLDEVSKNADPAKHGKLVQEAQALIQKYTAYIDGEPMVAELDKNPVHPLSVRKTLDAALAALSKAAGASGQAAPTAARAA